MDVINTKNFRELLVKKPFYEVTPAGYMKHRPITDIVSEYADVAMPEDTLYKRIKTPADFLREFYPSGHRIWDEKEYPDIYKQNPEDGKWYKQPITRTAFAFQQVIWTKHVLHVTGNDVQFEISEGDDNGNTEEYEKILTLFRKGWLTHSMETMMFEAVASYMKVAEAAIVGFFDENNKYHTKTLAYDKGDMLYAHYDQLTGEEIAFARKYYDLDEEGNTRTEYVEVWDKTFFYRFRKDIKSDAVAVIKNIIANMFGVNGYVLAEKKKHGFPFMPVAYMRNDDGPCWSASQRNIEDFEEAFSYLCENNKAYAFPMLKLKGEGEDISVVGDNNGAAKTIMITDPNGDASFINGTDASNAFATQLNKSYDLIYEMSFTVKPPELKSGDLPGVALKLLYSPAIEVAMNDIQKISPFLEKVVRMTKYGIGMEENCVASMSETPINAWMEPYIHQNDTELVTNLATAVQNEFLSKQTASERNSKYSKNKEIERVIREKKEEQQMDLLMELKRTEFETQNAIYEQEQTARINSGQSGEDVNTGRSPGRPNKSGKTWDENGNFLGENNWDEFNKKN